MAVRRRGSSAAAAAPSVASANHTLASPTGERPSRARGRPNAIMAGRYGKWVFVATGRAASGPRR